MREVGGGGILIWSRCMLSLVIFLKKFASCRLFFLRCYENRRSIQEVDNENTGSLKKITFAKKCKIHVSPIPREIPLLNSSVPRATRLHSPKNLKANNFLGTRVLSARFRHALNHIETEWNVSHWKKSIFNPLMISTTEKHIGNVFQAQAFLEYSQIPSKSEQEL